MTTATIDWFESRCPGPVETQPLGHRKAEALKAILVERVWQDEKHGPLETHGHTVGEWVLIAEAELEEAKAAILKGGTGRNAPMHELVQVAATCLAALEQHGIGELSSKWGDR